MLQNPELQYMKELAFRNNQVPLIIKKNNFVFAKSVEVHWPHGLSASSSRLSSLGLSPGQGHWVVFLGKALTCNSHSASLHPAV